MPVDDRIPPFLTVEEASRLLKIGRTKAYLLTQEYRATDGRSGLPVVDLGDVLRVPGPAIERMLGIGQDAAIPDLGKPRPASGTTAPEQPNYGEVAGEEAAPAPIPVVTPHAAAAGTGVPASAVPVAESSERRRRRPPSNQLPLFQTLTPTAPTP
jgi:hypothetical protein